MALRLAAAYGVVFLDLPTAVCLWRMLKRRGRITWEFTRLIASYGRRRRPQIIGLLAEHSAHAEVVVLSSRRGVARFVQSLSGDHDM